MRITFDIDMSSIKVGQGNPRLTRMANHKLLWLLESLIRCNQVYLKQHPKTPALYSSGVVYKREGKAEDWKDVRAILRDRQGDCEDLASWRAAELRERGINAKAFLKWQMLPNQVTLYHVMVKLPDGTLDDPSKRLGMGGEY